jgi:hypothetical protein
MVGCLMFRLIHIPILWTMAAVVVADAPAKVESPPLNVETNPMRYLENERLKFGINLAAGGAVTYLEDKTRGGGNMINSHDWGRQIQLSYYSGPVPFIGPNGEKPHANWSELGWNPIQAGSVGGVPSKTTFCESGPDFIRVRCIPMQWPHDNLPGDCVFEVTYRITAPNVILMEARLINDRLDKRQHLPARDQEMPALYTNGPWYRLVTYLGDKPFTGAPLTTVVDKGDGKGWPWSRFLATEQWCALVNRDGNGVGLYQPETARMCGGFAGFAGGDDKKGSGGPHDVQTGYISPLARRIIDHNIDWTYRTHIVAGSLEEIREFAAKQPRRKPAWNFDADRDGWHYEHAADTGWPIRGGLDISFAKAPRGTMVSDERLWHAEDAAKLEIEAAFHPVDGASTLTAEAFIQPFGRDDTTDFHSWAAEQSKEAMA